MTDAKDRQHKKETKSNPDDLLRYESSEKKNDFVEDLQNEFEEENSDSEDMLMKIINNANQYFLLKILSPEIRRNESKKRVHKDKLISIVKVFLICQFFILSFLLFGTVISILIFHGFKNDIELSYIESIIKFISLYIASVVAELIAMLHFIVSNVFDTSITGLVELYKDATGNRNEIIKEQENL